MKNKLTKSNLIIAQRGVSLVVVFAVLVVSLLAVIPLSYGWFAKNNKVTASGMHTQAYKSDFTVTYAIKTQTGTSEGTPVYSYVAADVEDLFAGLKAPGDSIEIQVTVTSKAHNLYPVKITGFGLEAPSADQDAPKHEVVRSGDTTVTYSRYLSTELNTQLIGITNTANTAKLKDGTLAPIFLRTTNAAGKVLGVDEEASRNPGAAGRVDYVSNFVKDGTISLNKGESVTFTIKLSFVNTNYDQNIYKNFATTGGKCEREFFFTYEDVLPKSNG